MRSLLGQSFAGTRRTEQRVVAGRSWLCTGTRKTQRLPHPAVGLTLPRSPVSHPGCSRPQSRTRLGVCRRHRFATLSISQAAPFRLGAPRPFERWGTALLGLGRRTPQLFKKKENPWSVLALTPMFHSQLNLNFLTVSFSALVGYLLRR